MKKKQVVAGIELHTDTTLLDGMIQDEKDEKRRMDGQLKELLLCDRICRKNNCTQTPAEAYCPCMWFMLQRSAFYSGCCIL